MYILKRRAGSTENWPVYHKSVGNTHALYLNTTDAQYDYANFTNDTSPTSAVFTVGGSNDQANPDGSTMVAYCFAEKQGYSKFGSYEGNGNVNGPYVHLGFKPAFLITKPIDAADNWNMFDNKRLAFNSATSPFAITPNNANLETTDTHQLDFLSNGFKINNGGNTVNRASTFIYWAFAESPFVTSTGIPTTAR